MVAPPATWLLLQLQPQIVPPAVIDSHLVQEEVGSTARAPGYRHRQQPPIQLWVERHSPGVRAQVRLESRGSGGEIRGSEVKNIGSQNTRSYSGYIWHIGHCAQGHYVAESEVRG